MRVLKYPPMAIASIASVFLALFLSACTNTVNSTVTNGCEKTTVKKGVYDFIGCLDDELALVKKGGALVGRNGYVTRIVEDDIEDEGGVAFGRYGFVNEEGVEVIPVQFDFANEFSEGLAEVEVNGKHGFIDKTGKLVVPLKYDTARPLIEGRAMVGLNKKHGFVNKEGKVVIPLKYDGATVFREGLADVEINDKYGFGDSYGPAPTYGEVDYQYRMSKMGWEDSEQSR